MNSFRRHFYIHRPFLLQATFLLASAIGFSIWAATNENEVIWVTVAIFTTVLFILFILLQVWFYLQSERTIYPQVARWMMAKGRIDGEDQILFPYVCDSRITQSIISRLTTGKLWLVDLYSPQVMTASTTQRTRIQDVLPEKDPRFKPISGEIDLIPFQDAELDVVILFNIVNEITQFGDRKRFLTEVSRVLKPNGRILLFEPIKSTTRTLVNPTAFFRLWTKAELKFHLEETGFTRIEIQTPATLTLLGRAITPGRYENTPLPLEF